MIYYTNINTPVGNLGLVRNNEFLLRIYLPNDIISEYALQKRYPNDDINENTSGFEIRF
ncbi:MAG: hypothetical protein GWP19_15735 [Planctomycetia bacterium]|nr:hypothetical protein [Planctomycetia bacterium]